MSPYKHRTQRLQNQAQVSEQLAESDQIQQRLDFSQKAYALAKDRLASDRKEVQRYRSLW